MTSVIKASLKILELVDIGSYQSLKCTLDTIEASEHKKTLVDQTVAQLSIGSWPSQIEGVVKSIFQLSTRKDIVKSLNALARAIKLTQSQKPTDILLRQFLEDLKKVQIPVHTNVERIE